MKRKVSIFVLLILLALLISALPALAGDPSGAATGGKADFDFLYAGKSVKDAVGHTAVSTNFIWVLLTGFLILFFQTGFALVETGFCRAKNAVHTIMMNFVVFAIGAIGWYTVGFTLAFGGAGGFPTLGGGTMLNGLFQVAKYGGSSESTHFAQI